MTKAAESGGPSSEPAFDRFSEFYDATFAQYVRRSRSLEALDLIEVSQPPGDFSDMSTSNLVITRCLSRARLTSDWGAGRFSSHIAPRVFFVQPPGFATTVVVDRDHRVDAVAIQWDRIEQLRADEGLVLTPDFGAVHRNATSDMLMSAMFDDLWTLDPLFDSLAVERAMIWISHRLEAWRDWPRSPTQPARQRLSPWALRRAVERLDQRDGSNVTLADLATDCRMSSAHFCRAFKATTGAPPHRYLIELRIARAQELLAHTSLSVAEVAEVVGYVDVAYFTRLFRRETGFPPAQWRRERAR